MRFHFPVAVLLSAHLLSCSKEEGDFLPVAPATADCKRGLAWPGRSVSASEISPALSWWYNWGLQTDDQDSAPEFVPMVWGGEPNAGEISPQISEAARFLLGFNEPNFFEQADISAQNAAARWPTLEQIANEHDLFLVSPAVNFCGNDEEKTGPCHDTNPFDYLEDFFAACVGCRVDYVAVHWYNCDTDSLKWYLGEFKRFGRPIWLTEFACAYGGDTSAAGQEAYMRAAIPVLEADPDVFRYAWFSADPIPEARLLNEDGTPTDLGRVYASLPHNPACVEK